MSARPPAPAARALGAGCYRVFLTEAESAEETEGAVLPADLLGADQPRFRLEPLGDEPPARVESVAAPTPGAPRRWSIVVSVAETKREPQGTPLRYWLAVAGHGGRGTEITLDDDPQDPADLAPFSLARHPARAAIGYTARDFDGLRTRLLAAVAQRVGVHAPLLAADEAVALVEEMAYLGDALSYYQDAIATEAYLSTARRRISVARHAALLGYPVDQGRSARAWIRVQPAADVTKPFVLPAGTKLLTAVEAAGGRIAMSLLPGALAAGAVVFETTADVAVTPDSQLPPLVLDRATHPGRRLRSGDTSVTVHNPLTPVRPGELMLVTREAGQPTDPDPLGAVLRVRSVTPAGPHRSTLRWDADDALSPRELPPGELRLLRGNLVIADHGSAQAWRELPLPVPGQAYWPRLPAAGTSFTVAAACPDAHPSAAAELAAAQVPPLPAIRLLETGQETREWTVRRSLLDSGPLALDFVVEVEEDGCGRLRFGDDANGMRPHPGTAFRVKQRVGGGAAGNLAAGSLRHACTDDARVAGISQPSASAGGADPEPLASMRQHAPEKFRVNQRAVLPDDYVRLTLALFPGEVTDAVAEITGDGSAPVAVVHVHTGTWPGAGPGLTSRVMAALAERQPLGRDLLVLGAADCPIDIDLEVTPETGALLPAVRRQIDDVLRRNLLAADRFGFGVSLFRSTVVALVATIQGVADATCARFAFAGEPSEYRREVLTPGRGQILRLGNEPGAGRLTYQLRSAR